MKSVPWFYIKLVFVRFQGKEGNIAHFICIALGIKSVFPLLRRIFSSSEVSRQNIETFGAGLFQMLLRWGFTKRLSWYLCYNNKTIKKYLGYSSRLYSASYLSCKVQFNVISIMPSCNQIQQIELPLNGEFQFRRARFWFHWSEKIDLAS